MGGFILDYCLHFRIVKIKTPWAIVVGEALGGFPSSVPLQQGCFRENKAGQSTMLEVLSVWACVLGKARYSFEYLAREFKQNK